MQEKEICYPNTELPIGSLVLTEEEATRIHGMFTSKDAENYIIAQNLILKVNLTIPSNWHYLYQMLHSNYSVVNNFVNLRTKKGRDFNKVMPFREMYNQTEVEFIKRLVRKDLNLIDDFIQKNYKEALYNYVENKLNDLIIMKLFDISFDGKNDYPHLKKEI